MKISCQDKCNCLILEVFLLCGGMRCGQEKQDASVINLYWLRTFVSNCLPFGVREKRSLLSLLSFCPISPFAIRTAMVSLKRSCDKEDLFSRSSMLRSAYIPLSERRDMIIISFSDNPAVNFGRVGLGDSFVSGCDETRVFCS